MQSGFIGASVRLVLGMAFLGLSCSLLAQDVGATARAIDSVPSSVIPDAPTPQIDLAAVDPQSAQSQNPQQPAADSSPSSNGSAAPSQNSSSSTQNSTPPAALQQSQHDKAAEQIKEQEK